MTEKKQRKTQDEQTLVTIPQNKMLSYQEIEQIGRAFVASGMFGREIDKISKAITKIMAGQELGMAPFAAMRAIHVIEGNATLSANTMAAMIKRSGRYDYEVKEKTATKCVIDFFETRNGARRKIGTETFDESEARAANLMNKSNWRNYPKSMMFARCMSNGVRTYAPDVFNGMLVYTPDEMGGKVDDSGAYAGAIDGEVVKPEPKPEAPVEGVDPIPEDEIDQTPPPEVDEEFKKDVREKANSIGLNTRGEMWLLGQICGRPFSKWELTDNEWLHAEKIVQDILEGRLVVASQHVSGDGDNGSQESEMPTDDPMNQVKEMFPGAETTEPGGRKDLA